MILKCESWISNQVGCIIQVSHGSNKAVLHPYHGKVDQNEFPYILM
jgi:hypothetical protein